MRRLSVLLVAGFLTTTAVADEITQQIDQARSYYEDGELASAIGELEFALQAMRSQVAVGYLATFPQPAAGWTMQGDDDAQTGAAPLVGAMLQRTYRRDDGEGTIEAQLMTGGGFMQGLAAMFMNPQIMAAQPNAERIRVGRENAVLTFDPTDRSGQLMLDLGGKVSIMLQGSGLDDGTPMTELIDRWDLQKVKEIAGS